MKNRITPIFVNRWLFIMLFFVSIVGCKKSDAPVGIIGLCPEVAATDPMLNAVDVELEKTISITFNTAMDPLTINTSTVLVKQLSTSTSLVGTVAATSNAAVFTFTPVTSLLPFTNYEVTVTNKATSTYRTAMKADYVFSYTTIPKLSLSSFPVIGGTTTGGGLFAQNAKVAISAVPAAGYTFANWTDSGTTNIVSTSPNYQYTMFGNHALVANFSPIVLGNFAVNLSSSPVAGGTTTGSGAYVIGSDVAIVATPNPGYSFVNWTEGATVISTSSSYQIAALSSDKTWVANFKVIPAAQLAVVLSSSPAAGGTTAGSGAFLPGTSVTVAANHNVGYSFISWTDLLSGAIVSTSPAFTFVISTNRSLVANFSIDKFTITTTAVNGSVTANPSQVNYNYGTNVQLTAIPNVGYVFTSWSGDATSVVNPLTISMTTNKNIIANFTALYTLNTTAVHGSVVKSPNQSTYLNGTTVQLVATPNIGYIFTSWSGDASGTANPLTVSMNGSKNIAANFVAVIPPVVLGTIANFGAYGGNAGITNQGLHTVINNGSIGSTAASSLITGFHDGITAAVYTETPLNVGNVTGGIYTAPPAPGTSATFATAQTALLDATTAYNSISPASKPGGTDPGAGELGGLTLAPGTYMSASGTFKITNLDLVLDAQGNPNAVWIFQTAAGLTVGTPAGARSIVLTGGALAKNVFWYVGSAAVINYAGGGTMVGTIIANSGVTLSSPGNSTTTTAQTILNGRAISLVSSVTMVNTIINNQ